MISGVVQTGLDTAVEFCTQYIIVTICSLSRFMQLKSHLKKKMSDKMYLLFSQLRACVGTTVSIKVKRIKIKRQKKSMAIFKLYTSFTRVGPFFFVF